ncbi:hypothetical protein KC19_6G008700 [Ceratodon purpureus]|uniref:Uncharacterized protein n=1 Tax=Ceratodon purpureus TaxID=3225 RepID=A0A8T0HC87_CERPU|nr:hypothetical protein KC19_6G008700 [Ceratodon purpureus]
MTCLWFVQFHLDLLPYTEISCTTEFRVLHCPLNSHSSHINSYHGRRMSSGDRLHLSEMQNEFAASGLTTTLPFYSLQERRECVCTVCTCGCHRCPKKRTSVYTKYVLDIGREVPCYQW